jgi:hypothetical protein
MLCPAFRVREGPKADFFHCGTRYELVRSDVIVASASRQRRSPRCIALRESKRPGAIGTSMSASAAYLQTSMVERQV